MAKAQTKNHENAIYVTEHRVSCDGGGGALGHPKTFYDFGDKHETVCLYCGQKFVLKAH